MQNQHNRKLKVAILLPSLANLGPNIVARNIVRALKQQIEFEVFYFDAMLELDFEVPQTQLHFFKKHDFTGFDLIHSHMLRPDLYIALHGLHKKFKVMSTLHQYVDDVLFHSYNRMVQFFFSRLWKFALSKMNHIVCLNQHMANYYRAHGLNTQISFIYNGIFLNPPKHVLETDQIMQLKSQYRLLGSIALIRSIKGLEQIIQVLVKDTSLYYIHIGDGEEKQNLLDLASTLQVADRIWFMGFKPNAADYLPLFDVFVMPSRSEGFCMALVEAIAAGRPVVCSQIDSFKEMFQEDEVEFFELDNHSSLKQAIQNALQADTQKVKRASLKYEEKYTLQAMGKAYQKIYKELSGT